jgi:hypothetical protein
MIVYTITNKVTNDVWVGTSTNSGEERFAQFCDAMDLGIPAQIYKDLQVFGVDNFIVEEYAYTEDREELKELFGEAIEINHGKSLTGVKTTLPKQPEPKPARAVNRAETSSPQTSRSTSTAASPVAKEQIATGKVSASREKIIKEKLAQEKANLESIKNKQIIEQAGEMAAILARLEERNASIKKR